MCMGEAPQLFKVDSNNYNHLLIEEPDLSLLRLATKAAEFCPNQAIKIISNKNKNR